MSEATAFQNSIPDGWYDDPAAPNMQRWWSGSEWTDHVRYSDRPRPYVAAAVEPAPLVPVTPEWPSAPAHVPFSGAPTEQQQLASAFNDLYVPMRQWQIGSVSSAQLVKQRRSAKVVVLWVVALAAIGIAAGVAVWLLLPR